MGHHRINELLQAKRVVDRLSAEGSTCNGCSLTHVDAVSVEGVEVERVGGVCLHEGGGKTKRIRFPIVANSPSHRGARG